MAKKTKAGRNRVYQGVPAAPGIAVGPARRIEDQLDIRIHLLGKPRINPAVQTPVGIGPVFARMDLEIPFSQHSLDRLRFTDLRLVVRWKRRAIFF